MAISDSIILNNNHFIAFNKPPGLAVQQDKSGEKALVNLAEIYCKSKLYVLHRIDRPASGVVVFVKKKKSLTALQDQLKNHRVRKIYLAAVRKAPEPAKGQLIHYLRRDGRKNKSYALKAPAEDTKKAILEYEVIQQTDHYFLLQIVLHTGRHHQIRAQLAAIDSPIKGDVKYGFRRSNADRSIHLHAWQFGFLHPATQQEINLSAPLPDDPVWNALKNNL